MLAHCLPALWCTLACWSHAIQYAVSDVLMILQAAQVRARPCLDPTAFASDIQGRLRCPPVSLGQPTLGIPISTKLRRARGQLGFPHGLGESSAQTFCACCAYQGADHGLGSQCCIDLIIFILMVLSQPRQQCPNVRALPCS